jgi:hypothetical protein
VKITRIVSGGQTGADRAALDVARELGIDSSGWCPKGRRAEDGVIPVHYPLEETPSRDYPQRTEWNVRDSDATLVLTLGTPDRGTALTLRLAARAGKPHLALDLGRNPNPSVAIAWLERHRVKVLNVAGPRESRAPGIGPAVASFLHSLLSQL